MPGTYQTKLNQVPMNGLTKNTMEVEQIRIGKTGARQAQDRRKTGARQA